MSTATAAPKPAATGDLYDLLAPVEKMPLDEFRKLVGDDLAINKAWARGDIEFGRQAHCVTGNPDVPASSPTLFIEDGLDWTGPKTSRHKRFAGLLVDAAHVPECAFYRKYVKEVKTGKRDDGSERWEILPEREWKGRETRWTTVVIDRAEAVALFVFYVRLTDKGLGGMAA